MDIMLPTLVNFPSEKSKYLIPVQNNIIENFHNIPFVAFKQNYFSGQTDFGEVQYQNNW